MRECQDLELQSVRAMSRLVDEGTRSKKLPPLRINQWWWFWITPATRTCSFPCTKDELGFSTCVRQHGAKFTYRHTAHRNQHVDLLQASSIGFLTAVSLCDSQVDRLRKKLTLIIAFFTLGFSASRTLIQAMYLFQ